MKKTKLPKEQTLPGEGIAAKKRKSSSHKQKRKSDFLVPPAP